MASFPLDTSNYIVDLFFGWVFTPLKYFRKNPPNSSNLFEIPNSIKFGDSLKRIREAWSKESKRKKPSFFKVILKIIFKDLLVVCTILFFGNFLNLFQAVFINLIIRYLESANKAPYEGALLTFFFIFSSILGCGLRHNASLRSLLLTGKIKNLVAVM